jgi:hypothetical protein
VFLRNWTGVDWARIVVHVVTISMAFAVVDARARRLLTGALIIAGAGVLPSLVGGDVVHNVLITQAQPWRALWLLALLGGLGLGRLLQVVLWERRESDASGSAFRRVAVSLLLLSWFMLATSEFAATLALLAILLWKIPDVLPSMVVPPTILLAMVMMVPLLIVVIVWMEARVVFEVFAASPDRRLLWHLPTFVLAGPTRPVSLAVAYALWRRGEATLRWSGAWFALTAAGVAATLLLYDSRTAFERSLEGELDVRIAEATGKSAAPPSRVDVEGPVVWPDGEVETWAFFGAAGYGNDVQGIPRVFSRTLAVTWAERRKRLIRLQTVARAPRYRLRLDRL